MIEQLNISEGDRVLMKIEGNRLVLEFIPGLFLPLSGLKNGRKHLLKSLNRSLRGSKMSYTNLKVLLVHVIFLLFLVLLGQLG